jgi:hypothetical protein
MKTIISTPRYQLDDNHGAAAYGGFELVDTVAIPPRTMAIGMHEGDARLVERALNHHAIAEELFDMLEKICTVALSVGETYRTRIEAIDLLERVEGDVKDK